MNFAAASDIVATALIVVVGLPVVWARDGGVLGEPLRFAPGAAAPLSAGLDSFAVGSARLSVGAGDGGEGARCALLLSARASSPYHDAGLHAFCAVAGEGDKSSGGKRAGAVLRRAFPPLRLPAEAAGATHASVAAFADGARPVGLFVAPGGALLRAELGEAEAPGEGGGKVLEWSAAAEVSLPKLPDGIALTGAWLLPCVPADGPPAPCASRSSHGAWLVIEASTGGLNRAQNGLEHAPYDQHGVWDAGTTPRATLFGTFLRTGARPVSRVRKLLDLSERGIQAYTHATLGLLAPANGTAGRPALLAGSLLGALHTYDLEGEAAGEGAKQGSATLGMRLTRRRNARADGGAALLHPSIFPHALPWALPGEPPDAPRHVIAGGEGGLYLYRRLPDDRDGAATFAPPVPVVDAPAPDDPPPYAYAGSLPAPAVVDWDNDGDLDVLVGNSEGRLLLLRNYAPPGGVGALGFSFGPPEPVLVVGDPVHVQPFRPLQGPYEWRYGYTNPAVVDWDGDGLPDIVFSDATAEHTLLLNVGTKGGARFDRAQRLLVGDLPLHGMWRVRPGVRRDGRKLLYVALDGDDTLHAWSRDHGTVLRDEGKLQLTTGRHVQANFRKWPGSAGRLSVELVDWDADGVLDLLLGTHAYSAVPDAQSGLPHALPEAQRGATVLLLRGTVGEQGAALWSERVRFAFPEQLRYDGKPLLFGSHKCSPAAVPRVDGRHDLLVGEEGGRLVHFERARLSSASFPGGFA